MIKALPLLFLFAFPLLFAQSSKELLRDGLFAEESEGDLKTATEKYEALLAGFEKERKVAAVALYRLAVVKRKEGDEKGALALYEEFARKFGDIEPQTGLVKENYLALSGKPLAFGEAVLSEEDKELARLRKLAVTSPDVLKAGVGMRNAVRRGWIKVVAYLLEMGVSPNAEDALQEAVDDGNLELCRLLLNAGADPDEPVYGREGGALREAVEDEYWEVVKLLLEKGADRSALEGILINQKLAEFDLKELQFLVEQGADPNFRPKVFRTGNKTPHERELPPLHRALWNRKSQFAAHLLKLGAEPELAIEGNLRPFHLAARSDDRKVMEMLLAAGADPNVDAAAEVGIHTSRTVKVKGRPIEMVGLENVPFLLEQGAEPTSTLLGKVILEKDEKALKALIAKGVDLNAQVHGHRNSWPLDLASGKMIEILFRHGARKTRIPSEKLALSLSDPKLREQIYPELASPDRLVVVMPDYGPDRAEMGIRKIKIETDVLSAVLSIQFPFYHKNVAKPGPDPFASVRHDPDLLSLTWKVFREEGFRAVDWTKLSPSTFQAGDVIEIAGLGEAFLRQPSNFTTTLAQRSNHPISHALLKLRRFPIKVTLDGRMWDLMICPDKAVWDSRTNEVPNVGLGELLHLVDNMPFAGRNIVIDRQGIGKVTYDEGDEVLGNYPLQANDHITVVLPERAKDEASRNERRAQIVEVFAEDELGGRGWLVSNSPPPTLLQVFSDLNPGLNFPNQGAKAREFGPSQPDARVFPAIDLSKIVVHRLTEEGEITIDVNLREKIEDWNKSGKKKAPFDFQLEAGDRIQVASRNDGPVGLLDDEVGYFKAALEVSFVVQELEKPPYRQEVTFDPLEWVQTLGGPIPTQKNGQKVSVKKGQLSIVIKSPVLLLREGVSHLFGQGNRYPQRSLDYPNSLRSYWPREGDLLVQKKFGFDWKPVPRIPDKR